MAKTNLKVGEYQAHVAVEGEEIEHYGIEVDEEGMVATCWIPSTAGKHFGIWVKKGHTEFSCEAAPYIDGSLIEGGGITLLKSEKKPKLIEDVLVGEDSVRPLLFGMINLTDDESALSTRSYEDLGTIRVEICRITNYRTRCSSGACFQVPENSKVPERAKKSATHQVMFGQTKKIGKQGSVTFKSHEKVATFIFRYRSLDVLRASNIARLSPENVVTEAQAVSSTLAPANSPRKRKASELEVKEEGENNVVAIDPEDEEDKRKEAQLQAELEKIRVRRERRKVKHESKPAFLPGEIIDLTV